MKKMKNKGYKAGGKMKAKGGPIRKMKKGMKVKGYKAGGKPDFLDFDKDGDTTESMKTAIRSSKTMKAKGGTIKKMAKGGTIRKMKGGKMVTKGGTKGGAKGGKAKVRGAGIAQRGVRPAKMR